MDMEDVNNNCIKNLISLKKISISTTFIYYQRNNIYKKRTLVRENTNLWAVTIPKHT